MSHSNGALFLQLSRRAVEQAHRPPPSLPPRPFRRVLSLAVLRLVRRRRGRPAPRRAARYS